MHTTPALTGALGRYFLQATARDLLPDERVRHCLRTPREETIKLLYGLEHHVAFWGGLQTCGSIWHCPPCSSKISERRRIELSEAIKCYTGWVVMVTFTMRHLVGDWLCHLVNGLLGAHRRLKEGAPWVRFRERVGLVGTIRALEVTHGGAGWHPHLHELYFLPLTWDVEYFGDFLRSRWTTMLARAGMREVNEYGFRITLDMGQLGAYVSKLGHVWDIAAEMTKSHLKRSRSGESRSIGQLLHDAATGDHEAARLWTDYAETFKGRRFLVWSKGLRARLIPDIEEKTDEELADEGGELAVVLASITREQWRIIIGNDLRADLVNIAGAGDPLAVRSFLNAFGIELQ